LTDLRISPTVHGVLAARIDRLAPEEKLLLQQLSVIGRAFPRALVQRVITLPDDELSRLASTTEVPASSRRFLTLSICLSTLSPRKLRTTRYSSSAAKPSTCKLRRQSSRCFTTS
jgi:hypothetical protein